MTMKSCRRRQRSARTSTADGMDAMANLRDEEKMWPEEKTMSGKLLASLFSREDGGVIFLQQSNFDFARRSPVHLFIAFTENSCTVHPLRVFMGRHITQFCSTWYFKSTILLLFGTPVRVKEG